MDNSVNEKLFYKREFLNKEGHHTLAAVFGEIDVGWHSNIKKKEGKAPDYENVYFQINDCYRRIELDFSSNTEKDWENSLEKIETLEKFITEFKEGLYKLRDLTKSKIKKYSDNDEVVQELVQSFSEHFAFIKVNDKTVYEFEVQRTEDNNIEIEIEDVEDEDLEDEELKKFVKEKEKKYNMKIKLKKS